MQQLSLKKYRRKDEVLHDASAVWEVEQIPGVQLAREFRSTCGHQGIVWRIFLAPKLAVKRHPGLRGENPLTSNEQSTIALVDSLRGQSFPTRKQAMQALEVKRFCMGIKLEAAE